VVNPRERPILFRAPMVRANRAGRKTQTRRIMNPQPVPIPPEVKRASPYDDSGFWWACSAAKSMLSLYDAPGGCPYGHRGDRLWVRETWAPFAVGNRTGISPQCVAYRASCDADGGFDYVNNGDEIMRLKVTKWKPSIFMPRWACRNVYEITEVRVQRVNEISEEDARAEGFSADPIPGKVNGKPAKIAFYDPIRWYAALWDAINGDRAPWASNPWVFAISYRPVPGEGEGR